MRVLFLLRKNNDYGSVFYTASKSGLLNSARITREQIQKYLGVTGELKICFDANSIDREVTLFKPHVCVLEALWVTPEKMREISEIHKDVFFVVRVHSEIPFLAHEGIAMEWLLGYEGIKNVAITFNSAFTAIDFRKATGQRAYYLPNIYEDVYTGINFPRHKNKFRKIVNVGCFGAIRPMKNHLSQAFAAIEFAEEIGSVLNFHINSDRLEHGGESVLKNLRALFDNSRHRLVEHPWLKRDDFLCLVRQMDIGMQVSFNESFNIVAADFVLQRVPVVVSPTIEWMSPSSKADPIYIEDMVKRLKAIYRRRNYHAYLNALYLDEYNEKAIKAWSKFLYG